VTVAPLPDGLDDVLNLAIVNLVQERLKGLRGARVVAGKGQVR
jgi:hypothetical protein